MIEIWRDILWYEWLYYVSNHWRVRSKRAILKKCLTRKWYEYVNLWKWWFGRKFTVHRLVGISFLERSDWNNEINHKDFNKENNRVDNLEWCNRRYNIKYSYDHWKQLVPKLYWKDHGNSVRVVQMDLNWNVIQLFDCIRDAERVTWSWNQNISKCCKWIYKTTNGFKWKYF